MAKEKKQVILYCNYTSSKIRPYLHLSSLKLDNAVRRVLKLPVLRFVEAAPWIEAFAKYFINNEDYTLHIVALHVGMKRVLEQFEIEGVHYHYVKSGLGIIPKVVDVIWGAQKKKGFPIYQHRFKAAIKDIQPDVVMICGAENPDYATAFLANNSPNKLVILQTLMNDPKRISMGVSTDYRREIEDKVLRHSNHFAVPDSQWFEYIKFVNPKANCYTFTFPTIEPIVDKEIGKQYDFVFFAGAFARNKGTNDVVSALSIVVKKYPCVTLNLIGGAGVEYMNDLHRQIKYNRLERNIIITPPFPIRNDVFQQVVKSNYAVLPGITASLNSTVREVMLMGLPTITYETPDTIQINQEKQCILTAKMESVDDLAEKMEYALIHPTVMTAIAQNGEGYARSHFSQEAFNKSFDGILKRCLNQ